MRLGPFRLMIFRPLGPECWEFYTPARHSFVPQSYVASQPLTPISTTNGPGRHSVDSQSVASLRMGVGNTKARGVWRHRRCKTGASSYIEARSTSMLDLEASLVADLDRRLSWKRQCAWRASDTNRGVDASPGRARLIILVS